MYAYKLKMVGDVNLTSYKDGAFELERSGFLDSPYDIQAVVSQCLDEYTEGMKIQKIRSIEFLVEEEL